MASKVQAMASKVQALASKVQALASKVQALASKVQALALRVEAFNSSVTYNFSVPNMTQSSTALQQKGCCDIHQVSK